MKLDQNSKSQRTHRQTRIKSTAWNLLRLVSCWFLPEDIGTSSRRPATISNKRNPSLCAWGLNGQKVCGLSISHLLNSSRDRNEVDGVKLIAFSELLVVIRGHGDIVVLRLFLTKVNPSLCVWGLNGENVCGLNIPLSDPEEWLRFSFFFVALAVPHYKNWLW